MGNQDNDGTHGTFHDDPNACQEYRELSRRAFLRQSQRAAAWSFPAWMPKVVLGQGDKRGKSAPCTLIYIFHRGGRDLHGTCSYYNHPYWDQSYTTQGGVTFPNGLRPIPGFGGDPRDIGLGNPDTHGPNDPYNSLYEPLAVVNGDAIGVNKAFTDRNFGGQNNRTTIWDIWQGGQGSMVWIPCAGSPDLNRSHFTAEALIEYATPNQDATDVTGWISRYLQVVADMGNPLRAAALTNNRLTPKSLAFAPKTLAFRQLSEVAIPGDPGSLAEREEILAERYSEQTQEPLKGSVLNAFQTAHLIEELIVDHDPAALYTNSTFAQMCQTAAELIRGTTPTGGKSEVEVIFMETVGHDNHAWQGSCLIDPEYYDSQGMIQLTGGGLYNRLKDYSQNMGALFVDLADHWNDVIIIEQSEFGRQIDQNGTYGDDHANASLMTVMGGSVNPGVHVKRLLGGDDGFPSLDPANMAANHDQDGVRTTIDYRQVVAEILRDCMMISQADIDQTIFPTVGEDPPPVVPFDAANELGIIS